VLLALGGHKAAGRRIATSVKQDSGHGRNEHERPSAFVVVTQDSLLRETVVATISAILSLSPCRHSDTGVHSASSLLRFICRDTPFRVPDTSKFKSASVPAALRNEMLGNAEYSVYNFFNSYCCPGHLVNIDRFHLNPTCEPGWLEHPRIRPTLSATTKSSHFEESFPPTHLN